MRITVYPTRMELHRLSRRFAMARRGHKLLKDKLDGLVAKVLVAIREGRRLRAEVEEGLSPAYKNLILGRGLSDPQKLEEVFANPGQRASLEISSKNIMGVYVPKFDLKLEGDPYAYDYLATPAEVDDALNLLSPLLPNLIHLAEVERTIEFLAFQIECTRRRVNALEYVLIPELQKAVRFIRLKLSEGERSAQAALLRIL